MPAPSDVPGQVAAETPGSRTLLAVVVGVVVVLALYLGREVLIPITLAVMLSFVLAPVVGMLQRLWLPQVAAVLLAVLLALAAILLIGGLIGTQVAGLAGDAPRYAATIERKLSSVRAFALDHVNAIIRQTGIGEEIPDGRPGGPTPSPDGPPSPAAPAARAATPAIEAPTTSSPFELFNLILAPVLGPLATTGIVLVVAIFVLLQRNDLRDRFIRLAGSADLHRTTTALDDAVKRLSRYFLAQLGINTAFGCLIALGLWLIGVPSPILWGMLAGLLRFVPYIGAPLSAALPLGLAAAVDPGWSMVIWTAVLFLVADLVTGQVVEPLVYGHSTGLSPLSVVVAAIFWGWLWGPVGLILSMPLTLCLVVLGRHVEQLEFLDVLLGDRPALTPAESFYQRMLANDPDDALDQAELLLADRPLSAYYDDVALKGLQLAARDAERGALPHDKLDGLNGAVCGLIDDLADHQDEPDAAKPALDRPPNEEPGLAEQAVSRRPEPAAPPSEAFAAAWRTGRGIVCLAGRSPLDEAASAMLAQLLHRHGLAAEVVPHEAVGRHRLPEFDPAGVTMICISYLEIEGNPAHLRYLIRRLRQRIPGVPVLVGLWPAAAAILTDSTLQSAVGADHFTASLHDSVETCLDVARKAAG